MHLFRSVITLVILLSFLCRSSSAASCCHLSATSACHTFQPYHTACQEYAYHFSPTFLLIAAHRCSLRRCSLFLLACLLFSADIELNPGPTNFTVLLISVLSFTHVIQPPCMISLSRIILICSVLLTLGLKTLLPILNLHSLLKAILLQSLMMVPAFLNVNLSFSFLLPCPSFPHVNSPQSLSSCLRRKFFFFIIYRLPSSSYPSPINFSSLFYINFLFTKNW